MRSPLLIPLVSVAAILIVVGRVNRRKPWGNRVAIAGYGLLAVAAVLAFVASG